MRRNLLHELGRGSIYQYHGYGGLTLPLRRFALHRCRFQKLRIAKLLKKLMSKVRQASLKVVQCSLVGPAGMKPSLIASGGVPMKWLHR